MAYNVIITKQVKNLLEHLSKTNQPECRELALLLLSLEKNPRPKGSRLLARDEAHSTSERVWQWQKFEILYRVNEAKQTVEVGIVSGMPDEIG